jgi:hypothetical protein
MTAYKPALNGINWDELELPDYEDPKAAVARLQQLHDEILATNGIGTEPAAGSPGFRPTLDQAREVAVMTALGLSESEIALVLNVEIKKLKQYYRKELIVANNLANAMVAKTALQMAISGKSPDMTKFWLKTRAKWKEVSGIELTGKDGGPMESVTPRDKLRQVLDQSAASGANGQAPKKIG